MLKESTAFPAESTAPAWFPAETNGEQQGLDKPQQGVLCVSLWPLAAHHVPAMSGYLCPTSSCFQSHKLEQCCFVSSHTTGQTQPGAFIQCCSALGYGAATTAAGLGHSCPPHVIHQGFFSSSSSSLPHGAHGSSDKSAPCHPGWLGESKEGKVTTSPTTPISLRGTPGQGCASRQDFPTMLSQQGGITFFKLTLEAPQLSHKPAAESGVLEETSLTHQLLGDRGEQGEIRARESPMEGHLRVMDGWGSCEQLTWPRVFLVEQNDFGLKLMRGLSPTCSSCPSPACGFKDESHSALSGREEYF